MMEIVTDLTVRQIGLTASQVMQRNVDVSADSNIGRDLGIDSLTLMNIVMELEDVFELSIPLDRLADVETAGDLAALINELRAKAQQ
jgi:acyl carrier protein